MLFLSDGACRQSICDRVGCTRFYCRLGCRAGKHNRTAHAADGMGGQRVAAGPLSPLPPPFAPKSHTRALQALTSATAPPLLVQVWVYEEQDERGPGNLYVHHSLMLPAFPLCVAWLDCDPSGRVSPCQRTQHGQAPAGREFAGRPSSSLGGWLEG